MGNLAAGLNKVDLVFIQFRTGIEERPEMMLLCLPNRIVNYKTLLLLQGFGEN